MTPAAHPRRFLAWSCLVVSLLGVACSAGSPARLDAYRSGAEATTEQPTLRRGMNFGDAMDAPNEGEWGVALQASDFQAVKDAGFDHVRIPMRVSAHAGRQAPFAIEPRFRARMDWAVDQALSRDLAVIIYVHHYR